MDNNHRPLIVEIGAGKGKHACLYANDHPNHNIVAIERTANKFNAFKKFLAQANLPNIQAIHADAIPYFVYAIKPHSIDHVFILYPNPELKNINQQWLNMPFFEFILSRVKPLGKITLATNIEDYIGNAHLKAKRQWCLPGQLYKVPKASARTHFEIKYLERGETCWELEIVKPKQYITHFDLFDNT